MALPNAPIAHVEEKKLNSKAATAAPQSRFLQRQKSCLRAASGNAHPFGAWGRLKIKKRAQYKSPAIVAGQKGKNIVKSKIFYGILTFVALILSGCFFFGYAVKNDPRYPGSEYRARVLQLPGVNTNYQFTTYINLSDNSNHPALIYIDHLSSVDLYINSKNQHIYSRYSSVEFMCDSNINMKISNISIQHRNIFGKIIKPRSQTNYSESHLSVAYPALMPAQIKEAITFTFISNNIRKSNILNFKLKSIYAGSIFDVLRYR